MQKETCFFFSFSDDFIVSFAKIVTSCDITKFYYLKFLISLFIYSFLYLIHLLLAYYIMNSIDNFLSAIHS